MNEGKFREYLTKTGHTEKSITSRINKLKALELFFVFNVDTIINNRETVIDLLIKIRHADMEDRRHTPISNSLRKYYTCMTNDVIGRIF